MKHQFQQGKVYSHIHHLKKHAAKTQRCENAMHELRKMIFKTQLSTIPFLFSHFTLLFRLPLTKILKRFKLSNLRGEHMSNILILRGLKLEVRK